MVFERLARAPLGSFSTVSGEPGRSSLRVGLKLSWRRGWLPPTLRPLFKFNSEAPPLLLVAPPSLLEARREFEGIWVAFTFGVEEDLLRRDRPPLDSTPVAAVPVGVVSLVLLCLVLEWA